MRESKTKTSSANKSDRQRERRASRANARPCQRTRWRALQRGVGNRSAGAIEGDAPRGTCKECEEELDGAAQTAVGAGSECEECRGAHGMDASDDAQASRTGVREVRDARELRARLGPGESLEQTTRGRMESAFGVSFADVRIHRGARAAAIANELDSHAFAFGNHVAFAHGAYQPGTPGGDALIAHELAHVLQQRDAADEGAVQVENDYGSDQALERDAGNAASGALMAIWARAQGAAATFGRIVPTMRSGLRLQRCATTTPDGVDVGPTDRSKTFCLKAGTFNQTFGVQSNTATAAVGVQRMTFEGESSGDRDGAACDCSCGLYRHWIRGFWRWGSATSTKNHNVSSCGNNLNMSETDYKEEYTSCIGDNDPSACKFAYGDAPGWSSGLANGTYVQLRYDFLHQVWDRCQGRSVATSTKTLNISGNTAPRSITWT